MDSLTTFDPSETVRSVWIQVCVNMLLIKCTVWLYHHQRHSSQEGMYLLLYARLCHGRKSSG